MLDAGCVSVSQGVTSSRALAGLRGIMLATSIGLPESPGFFLFIVSKIFTYYDEFYEISEVCKLLNL